MLNSSTLWIYNNQTDLLPSTPLESELSHRIELNWYSGSHQWHILLEVNIDGLHRRDIGMPTYHVQRLLSHSCISP